MSCPITCILAFGDKKKQARWKAKAMTLQTKRYIKLRAHNDMTESLKTTESRYKSPRDNVYNLNLN